MQSCYGYNVSRKSVNHWWFINFIAWPQTQCHMIKMFIHRVIILNSGYFTVHGMFVMYLKTFCPRKFNDGNENFEN